MTFGIKLVGFAMEAQRNVERLSPRSPR